jgi:hypothetical protein
MRLSGFALTLLLVPALVSQVSFEIKPDPNDPAHPLSSLVSQLRTSQHLAISYEDPRYSKPQDMREPNISFRYSDRDLEAPDGGELTLDRMLREYLGAGGLTFAAKKEAMRLYVVPEEVKNSKGERVRQGSILDTVISIAPVHRNGIEFLQAICEAVGRQTGYQIDIGPSAPVNNLQHYSTDEGANNQMARTVFVQLLDRATPPRSFAWDLYYDLEDKSYGLNFAYVGLAGPVRK